ncbi:MAG TPA: RNA-binding protein [Verrucomicrobiae bacterium]|nr:RNA-binding protein [Verrucomicrobiae bacterium]
MNSFEQPYGRWSQPQARPSQFPQKPFIQEDTLKEGELQIERKYFRAALKENARGRLLRITEEMGVRRNTIIIPATGLRDFLKVLDEMILAADALPQDKKPFDEAS